MDGNLQILVDYLLRHIDLDSRSLSLICRSASLDRSFVSRLKAGKTNLTMKSYLALCEVLAIHPSGGFGGEYHRTWKSIEGHLVSEFVTLDSDYSIETLLQAWNRSAGLVDLIPASLLGRSVIFSEPTDGMPQPIEVGGDAFAMNLLASPTAAGLSDMLKRSDPKLVENLAAAHIEALKGKPLLTLESGRFVWADGVSTQTDYARLLLPIHDNKGTRLILSYSKQI